MCKKAQSVSDVGVGDLAQEEDALCAVLSDNNHEWTVKPEDRDAVKRKERYSDACSS